MKQITAEEFKAEVERNPAWASTLTEPVEITKFCDMTVSNITHLSPLLHFTGRNSAGNVANFTSCKNLKVAEGTFAGWVSFSYAGIEKVGNLTVTQPNTKGNAASFDECHNLKVAEGTFPGWVWFAYSGIQKIGDLTITQPNNDMEAASFKNCPNLKVAKGTYPGAVDFSNSGIQKTGELAIARPNSAGWKADFTGCDLRLPAEFLGSEYLMGETTRQKNLTRVAVAKAQHTAPDLEI